MTRLFTRALCEECGYYYADVPYIEGKIVIEEGICLTCMYGEYCEREGNYDEDES